MPGNPTVVVKNVTDGKAIGASNKYFAEHGKDKDGSVVFGTSGSVQLPFIFKDERVRYQYKNMVPIFADDEEDKSGRKAATEIATMRRN